MTISDDETKRPAGADELPPWLAARYRSKRHLAALVEIGRVMRGVGMTWASLHRATENPAFADMERDDGVETDWYEAPAGGVLATVERLERLQPWEATSTAPMFMKTLRGLAARHERVRLSPRQMSWLELLMKRAHEVEAQRPEARTGNVVPFRRRSG
jgi:hypothetical protein